MKRYIIVAVVAFLMTTQGVAAQTSTETKQIAELQAQIQLLTAKIKHLQSVLGITPGLPGIVSASSTSVPLGGSISLTGVNFSDRGGNGTILLNNLGWKSYASYSDRSMIEFPMPEKAGLYRVQVLNKHGLSNSVSVEVVASQ